eukprot:14285203-Ditylum_brightwellii.AAC.1
MHEAFNAFLSCLCCVFSRDFSGKNKSGTKNPDGMTKRKLSIDFGGDRCTWTDAVPAGENTDIYGTLFASYPCGDMHATWQQAE